MTSKATNDNKISVPEMFDHEWAKWVAKSLTNKNARSKCSAKFIADTSG